MLKLQRLLYFMLVFSALQNSTCLYATDITETEEFIYAKSMILVRDQVSLTAMDILEDTEDSRNYFNVFNVDLSDFNFSSGDAGKIIDYFNSSHLLPNLRVIGLFNAQAVPHFIRSVFTYPKDRFYSLIRVDASRSDITLAELDVLFDYFKDSQCLIRDMEQICSRFGDLAASLSVDIAGSKGIHKHTDSRISTHYRVGSIRDAIFMIVKQ